METTIQFTDADPALSIRSVLPETPPALRLPLTHRASTVEILQMTRRWNYLSRAILLRHYSAYEDEWTECTPNCLCHKQTAEMEQIVKELKNNHVDFSYGEVLAGPEPFNVIVL